MTSTLLFLFALLPLLFLFALLPGLWLIFSAVDFLSSIRSARLERGKAFIAEFEFPSGLRDRLQKRYPHLTEAQMDRVFEGFRLYMTFTVYHGQKLAMPSCVVDCVWHDFLLYSLEYKQFCDKAFGNFFHHTPFEPNTPHFFIRKSLEKVWLVSCQEENIDPIYPKRLPLLFALDAELAIADGFRHSLANDYYPLPKLGITPSGLCHQIQVLESETNPAERSCLVAQLALRICQSLQLKDYFGRYPKKDLEKLFDAIIRDDDLVVAVFGDSTLAEAKRGEMKHRKEEQEKLEASCGCSSSCG